MITSLYIRWIIAYRLDKGYYRLDKGYYRYNGNYRYDKGIVYSLVKRIVTGYR